MLLIYGLIDVLALLAFVLIGKISHSEALVVSDIANLLWPFILAWFVCGWLLGDARPTARTTIGKLLWNTMTGWFLALPLALVLRELIYDKPILTAFAVTTFIFGGLLLLAGRVLVYFIYKKGERK